MATQAARLMFVAFYWKHKYMQTKQILQIAGELLTKEASGLKQQVNEQHREILRIIDNYHRMSTIRQEDTDEDDSQTESGQLNRVVSCIKSISRRVAETLNLYKDQMRKLAAQVVDWDNRNKELQTKLSKMRKKYEQQRPEPLPQAPPAYSQPLFNQNTHSGNVQKQDRKMWEKLNHKIEAFKKSLKIYEDQIKQKDRIIAQMKSCSKPDLNDRMIEELKKLKQQLTTLRGEKSILSNQKASMKKAIHAKQKTIEIQSIQLSKNRLEIEQLTSINRQLQQQLSLARNGLRQNQDVSQSNAQRSDKAERELRSYTEKYPKQQFDKMKTENQLLSRKIRQTEVDFRHLVKKLEEIELNYVKVSEKDKQTIVELQQILQQKNQTIVGLKAAKTQEKYEYYVQLIKNLNRKIFDRDQYIQQLKLQLNQRS